MQVFEIHFNPNKKGEKFFDSFVFEPENVYERHLGSLYIAGDLSSAPSAHPKFLENLAQVIKTKYYTLSAKSPERALSESLKKANKFLAEQVQKENVSWLGNLNVAIVASKKLDLSFAKTGTIKILLLRDGEIIDLSRNLDLQEIDPYPLKIFFGTASGKLEENDIVLVLNKEVYDFFLDHDLLQKIASVDSFDEKRLKAIFPQSLFGTSKGAKVSGVCLIGVTKKEAPLNEKPQTLQFQREDHFSLAPLLKPLLTIKKIIRNIPFPSVFQKKRKKKRHLPKFFLTHNPLKRFSSIKKKVSMTNFKRNVLIFGILLFLLLLGFLIFRPSSEPRQKIEVSLESVQEKVTKAEAFLIIKKEKEANVLLQEAWFEIERGTSTTPEILALKNTISQKLQEINKLETIENPELFVDLSQTIDFNPQRILQSGKNLYLYQLGSPQLYQVDIAQQKGDVVPNERKLDFADSLSRLPLFFSTPNTVLSPQNGTWQEQTIQDPGDDFRVDYFVSYVSNLYLFDKSKCEIIKYPYLGNFRWGGPQEWLKDTAKCAESRSMAIDGSIWILNKSNTIDRYHQGVFAETISLAIFPIPKNITLLKTAASIPYLYLVEPSQKRIIVLDKTGIIIKQFQSNRFDNLKDIAISQDGKTIWVLNEKTIYQLSIPNE